MTSPEWICEKDAAVQAACGSECYVGDCPHGHWDLKALTLYQPWASLIMAGVKHFETRSWATDYRGTLVIHAGAQSPITLYRMLGALGYARLDDICINHGLDPIARLPRGCILGTVRLVNCFPIVETTFSDGTVGPAWSTGGEWMDWPSAMEQALGDYTPGRYAWVLRDPKPLPEPIPCRGAQRLWTVPPAVAERMVG